MMEQSRVTDFDLEHAREDEDWTFAGADTNYMTHGLHPYPARMIPQVAGRLILRYSHEESLVWDPFCGSGTVIVESILSGRTAIGTDLNPFAVFLANVKTTPLDAALLRRRAMALIDLLASRKVVTIKPDIPEILNIDYWFKDYVQTDLGRLKSAICSVDEEDVRNFLLLCMASTVREVSNLKKREFKIVRMDADKLEDFSPDVFEAFAKHLRRCLPLMESFVEHLKDRLVDRPRIILADNRQADIPSESVDLIVTSPPYGDSGTTVAYGQFSKLPALWIGLDPDCVRSVDRRGLGGAPKKNYDVGALHSATLSKVYEKVDSVSTARARQLLCYFSDYNESLQSMLDKLKNGAYACIVIGNRLMSRNRIPTDNITTELGTAMGFLHEMTIARRIPTKRMPWQNAPENIEGRKADTMHSENIIVLRKK